MLASICAFILKGVFDPIMCGVTVPSVNYGQAFAPEFIIIFNLMFVVSAVATGTGAVSTNLPRCFFWLSMFPFIIFFERNLFF